MYKTCFECGDVVMDSNILCEVCEQEHQIVYFMEGYHDQTEAFLDKGENNECAD